MRERWQPSDIRRQTHGGRQRGEGSWRKRRGSSTAKKNKKSVPRGRPGHLSQTELRSAMLIGTQTYCLRMRCETRSRNRARDRGKHDTTKSTAKSVRSRRPPSLPLPSLRVESPPPPSITGQAWTNRRRPSLLGYSKSPPRCCRLCRAAYGCASIFSWARGNVPYLPAETRPASMPRGRSAS